MFYLTYEKHDKSGNWSQHKIEGFSDFWLAYKVSCHLKVNSSNVCNMILEEELNT